MKRDQMANELVLKEERVAEWERSFGKYDDVWNSHGRYDDEITEHTFEHKIDW